MLDASCAIMDVPLLQLTTHFYDSILAGAIPVIFDPKLPQILPFRNYIAWEDLLVDVSAGNITTQRANITGILKVNSLPHQSNRD